MMHSQTLANAADRYLQIVADSRSENTRRTYAQAVRRYLEVVRTEGSLPEVIEASDIRPSWMVNYLTALKRYAPATESLFVTAIMGFYEYLAAEEGSNISLVQIRAMLKRRQRKVAPRLPQFPREQIETIIDYVNSISANSTDQRAKLRGLRDRAFILTLSDTGLRISEACRLSRGSVDWSEGRAIVMIKGGRESLVRLSTRSLNAIKMYLDCRAAFDGASGRSLGSLPIFARHDDGAGKRVLRLGSVGAREIINKSVASALGQAAVGTITPHSFRHYFVTVVLRASGGNLKLAQELARHKNISITQRYAHLSDDDLDQEYHHIFNKTPR
jgi:integrase/recombinase XerC